MTALNKQALRQLAEESTQGEWWSDVVETDGEYGDGEDRASGYHSYAVYVGSESLLDMTNSTAACIHTEWDHDYLMAWDETAKRNAEFIAAANPATVLVLLDELEAAEKRIAEQREYYEGVIADGSRRIAELDAREIKPAKGEVLVVVSGFTDCGKSAIAGEIEISMKAIGVPVQWTNGDAEKRMTGADWLTAIEMYKPTVRIVEVNVPRAAGIGVKGE
ncbi:ead/Ea22-like family protein [Citrobacter freundii]|uniref:ead/Ea22-like family protein n=1 Tax=Citrobacter freundii TaxID=546 RepID=UPI0015EA9180|nr:ead/Ea22-like family protein [Citrobacter freundii]QLU14961.1 ead/Ea22-like family protein [Citrobacter freundii]QLU15535.1 ead/Ea22-like family protein [Citrobacter freundii]